MIKLSFLFEDTGNYKQVFKGDNNKYYCRILEDFYTCYSPDYEASEPINEEVFTIEGEGAEYKTVQDFCKYKTRELKESLRTYEDMKKYLLMDWNKEGYTDNYIYCNLETIEKITIEKYNYLGLELKLIKTISKHSINNKIITEYAVYQDNFLCEYIVGYEF